MQAWNKQEAMTAGIAISLDITSPRKPRQFHIKQTSKILVGAEGGIQLRPLLRACEDFGELAEFDGKGRMGVIRSGKDSLIWS